MPVCCVCEADGVAQVLGQWYCVDHLENARAALADYIARVIETRGGRTPS
jgi:hypothetical protein